MAIQGEHPIARWLDMTLPQLVNQHITNRDNRIHEKDMMRMREENQVKMMNLQADINQKAALNQYNLEKADEKNKQLNEELKANLAALYSMNIDAQKYEALDPKQQTDAGGSIFKELGEGIQRDIFSVVEQANTVSGQVDNINKSNEYLQESKRITDGLLMGANVGRERGKLVADLTGDDLINRDDFDAYLAAMENPFVEGTPEYQGFMSEIKSPEEQFKIGKDYVDFKNSQFKASGAQTTQQIMENYGQDLKDTLNQETGFFNAFDAKGKIAADELDEDFWAAVKFDPAKLDLNAKSIERNAENIDYTMRTLSGDIVSLIEHGMDSGSSAQPYADDIREALDKNDTAAIEEATRRAIGFFKREGSHNQLDFHYGPGYGGKDSNEHLYFNKMLGFYERLSNEKRVATQTSRVNAGLPEGDQVTTQQVKANVSVDQLNEELETPEPVEEKSHNVIGNTEIINEVDNTMYETSADKVSDLVTKLYEKQIANPSFFGFNTRNFIKGDLYQMWKPGGREGGTLNNPSTLTSSEYDMAIKLLDEIMAKHALAKQKKNNDVLNSLDKAKQMNDLAALLGGHPSGQSVQERNVQELLASIGE